MGRDVLARMRRYRIEPKAFVDNRATGVVDGLPVFTPDEAIHRYPSATVVVASLLGEYELREQLKAVGFRSVMTLSQLHYDLPHLVSAPYLDGAWESWREAPKIEWADEESQLVYAGILEYRQTRDVGVMAALKSTHPQYFPEFVDVGDTVADCGAYDGDTFRSMRRVRPDAMPAYYGFEPDPTNYAKLVECSRGYPSPFVAIQAGVGEREVTMGFEANGGLDSTFTPNGSAQIPVDTLDRFFSHHPPPTFIKMDIEGMEPAALRGASGLIKQHCPTLAICVYHEPRHLWEIPQLITQLNPHYQLTLRHYSTNMSETVMYAVA